MNMLFRSMQTLFANDNNAASLRAVALDELFRSNDKELIATALDAKQLADDLTALPAKQLAEYRERLIARGEDPANVAATCAEIASAYQLASTMRTCYHGFGEFPAIWQEFIKRTDGWNSRMEWIRCAMKEERAGNELNHNSAVAARLAENKGKAITSEQARQAALDLAEAAKMVKDAAKAEPSAVADAIVKLIEKRNANARAVVRAVVTAVFGSDYEILPAAEFWAMAREAEAHRKIARSLEAAA